MVWAAGQRLQNGKYIIEKILGQGGFGITYKALHTNLQALVVIKTPNEKLKNDPEYQKYLKRFIEEGRRLEKLYGEQHPNIVRVRDLFEERGIYCLVMDFVPGESLWDLVQRRGALPSTEAVEYVQQIGEALTVVHQAKLVHRDVHPGNIMVQSDGKAVLIDFGIAAEIFATTVSSKAFANLAFAPYEQIIMGSREPTVDIYSLAASLYYAVTGERPEPSCDRKFKKVRLIEPKQHANISDELNRAILKGMELEAKNRPQSMQEWLKLLEVGNRTVPVSLPPKKRRSIPSGWLIGFFLSNLIIGLYECHFDLSETSLDFSYGVLDEVCYYTLLFFLVYYLPDQYSNYSDSDYIKIWIFVVILIFIFSCIFSIFTDIQKLNDTPYMLIRGGFIIVYLSLGFKIKNQLKNIFSELHTFLIMVVTHWLGLWLGWFTYQIFPIFR